MAKDDDGDPVLNCLLEVCCLAGSDQQVAAMGDLLVKGCGCDPAMAKKVGHYIINKFDLAEKGTLSAFKQSIVRVYKARPSV